MLIFKALINELNSSVVILLAILFIVARLIYIFGQWKEKFKNQDDKLSDIRSVLDKVIALQTKVDLIYQNTNPNKLIESQSPIALTPKGEELSIKINAESIFKRHLAKLKEFVENENPQNAYDIQTTSIKIATSKMLNLLNQDELISIKNHAYKQGLLVEDIMQIFGIFLRDEILFDKDMSIHEVDVHAPNKN